MCDEPKDMVLHLLADVTVNHNGVMEFAKSPGKTNICRTFFFFLKQCMTSLSENAVKEIWGMLIILFHLNCSPTLT